MGWFQLAEGFIDAAQQQAYPADAEDVSLGLTRAAFKGGQMLKDVIEIAVVVVIVIIAIRMFMKRSA